MISPSTLIPLTVIAPMAVAATMLAIAHALPRYVPDVVAIVTAIGVAGLCAVLAIYAQQHGAMTYWFGGWTPHDGVTVGIGFGVDPVSAALASFIGLLFALTLIFAWGYFDEVQAHFHVLMLLLLAAMVGFCLTRDLFNLFVWFEVMSVAAFALTAYQLETPSLAAALNFTVVNSLASFLMLGGVGLIYARAGALDFKALGQAVARYPHDPVIAGAFCLLAAALMIKAAILPFQFWLSDAHAVAPSPVSVIFSGAMVSLGLFGLAKLTCLIFFASSDARTLTGGLFLGLGCATAVVGALMAWSQRHLKRMLAFSTISHLGVMLTAVCAMSPTGLSGVFIYIVGHGLVKGALFMLVGILLASKASVDELDLKGCGRDIWPVGLAMGFAGLLLAGAPLGVLDTATHLVHTAGPGTLSPWTTIAVLIGSSLTGATVLRATGRIFLNLGPDPGDEAESPSQQEAEKADRPMWLMLAPCLILLALATAPAHLAEPVVRRATAIFAGPLFPLASSPSSGAGLQGLAWLSTALAVSIAGLDLFRERLPGILATTVGNIARPPMTALKAMHSGLVGDYALWIVLGLASFSIALAFR